MMKALEVKLTELSVELWLTPTLTMDKYITWLSIKQSSSLIWDTTY